MTGPNRKYDVFLSYNWRDNGPVEGVAHALRELGITVFLDRWYVVPGRPWPQVLEEAIGECGAVAVFLGSHGMGHWQQREKDLALERQASNPDFPVIPVLLPGADPALGFLSLNTWVDMRAGLSDPFPMSVLVSAVRGQPPGPDAIARIESTLATVSPYRGLRPFREEDAPFFFGREAFMGRLEEGLTRHSLVALVGASGSGKSSVVRSGLIPHLRRGFQGEVWDAAIMVPGERPLHSLSAALLPLLESDMTEVDRLAEVGKLAGYMAEGQVALRDVVNQVLAKQPGTDRLLLAVDQMEELYTLSRDEEEGRRFVDELLDATDNGPLAVVLLLRGDFYGRALGYRPLADRLQDAVVNLGPMTSEELEQAVEAPSRMVGLSFEPGLVGRILGDVEAEPGNLPLMEFLLTDLWERRRAGQLTHEAYEDMGGVQGAMARRAEELYGQLADSDQEQLRRLFTQLVLPGEDSQDTRRRATFDEIGESARPLVQRLADARLLVTALDETAGEETVEVAHEALINNWERFRDWLDEDREFLLWRHRLRAGIAQWERGGRDRGILLRRAPLAEAVNWLTQRAGDLNQAEQAYIVTALGQRRRERWFRRAGVAAFATLAAVVAVVLLVELNVVFSARDEAEQARQATMARELATKAQLVDSPLLQVLLAIESLRSYSTLEGVSPLPGDQALRQGLAILASPVSLMRHDAEVDKLAFSPDGKWLATGSKDNTVRVWDAATGRELVQMAHDEWVLDVAFSPDGKALATASIDRTARIWDPATGRELVRVEHQDSVREVDFSLDGQWLATAGFVGGANSEGLYTYIWDAKTGEEAARLKHEGTNSRVKYSPDGVWLATGDDEDFARVWNTVTWKEVARMPHDEYVAGRAFSPDSKWLATASFDHTARVWEAATGEQVARVSHGDNVWWVDFSPDGKLLTTASSDKSARVWDTATWQELLRLDHEGTVRLAVFSPDGRRLATSGDERVARIWAVDTGREVARMSHQGYVNDLAFSPDGKWLATASDDGSARVWQASAGHPAVQMSHDDFADSLAFSPDGRLLVTGSFDDTARVWNAETGQEVSRITHKDDVVEVAFSPNGKWVATASLDDTAAVWEADTGSLVAEFPHQDWVRKAVFSPDSTLLATLSQDNTAWIWEAAAGSLVAELNHPVTVKNLAFSPDGDWVATSTGSDDNAIRVWSVATGEIVTQINDQLGAGQIDFSPDSRWLAVGNDKGIVQVWNAATGEEVSRMSHEEFLTDLTFSPDGRWLATASFDRTARVWDSATGLEVARVAHEDQVTRLAFSPDGMWVASTGRDNATKVWEAATGREVARITHDDIVTDLAFSPIGRTVATTSADGAVHLWLVWPEDLIEVACSRIDRNFTSEEWRTYFADQTYRATCSNLPALGE